jgi:hypothetical protein
MSGSWSAREAGVKFGVDRELDLQAEAFLAVAGFGKWGYLRERLCDYCGRAGKTSRITFGPDVCALCIRQGEQPGQYPQLSVPEARAEWRARSEERELIDLMGSTDDDSLTDPVNSGRYRRSRYEAGGHAFGNAAATRAEFLMTEGWRLERCGPTGNPNGRPKAGSVDVASVIETLSPAYSLSEYREAAKKRGPRNGSLPKLVDLARIVRACRQQRVNAAELAAHFDIRRQRIYELVSDRTL